MDTSQLYFAWQIDGRAAGTGNSISPVGSKPGTHTVTLEVWMNQKPRPVRLAATSRAVFVEAKPEDKKVVAAKPPNQATVKKTDTPKPVRSWAQLNEKERQGVLDCLCRCNSSATSSVAVSYNPKASDASPHCAKMSNGPCINQGFGCWRHVPDGGSKCAQECYGKYSVTGAPDSMLKAEKDSAAKETTNVEEQTRQFNECVKGSKDQLEDAQKELARVGQKDAPMFFRCGPIGTNWQMIPSNTCCDPFRRDSDKNMEAAAAALQRCGWNEEIQKRQTDPRQENGGVQKEVPGGEAVKAPAGDTDPSRGGNVRKVAAVAARAATRMQTPFGTCAGAERGAVAERCAPFGRRSAERGLSWHVCRAYRCFPCYFDFSPPNSERKGLLIFKDLHFSSTSFRIRSLYRSMITNSA